VIQASLDAKCPDKDGSGLGRVPIENRVKLMIWIAVFYCTLVVMFALLVHRQSMILPSRGGDTIEPPPHGIKRFWEGKTPRERLFFLQEAEGRDGPACVQMVLAYWKYYVDQQDLKIEMRTKENGTLTEFMDDPFKHRGLNVESGGRVNEFSKATERLQAEIGRGRPLIISVKTDDRDGSYYYVVVIGYYENGIIVNDPTREDGEHLQWDYSELSRTWSYNRFWMLIAYP
jgi:hypothetical protein